jgi:hypothetical protein
MKPGQLILRCYGEKKGEIWQAFCLDLNLAAQGNSFTEVRAKLYCQIESYLYDAIEGEDKQYAEQLLNRKAPLYFWIKYYAYKLINEVRQAKHGIRTIFNEVVPLHISDKHLHHHA